MEWIVALSCLVIGFFSGNFRREVTDKLKELRSLIDLKKDKPDEKSKSVLIDPLDPEQEAKRQYEEQMRDLNG